MTNIETSRQSIRRPATLQAFDSACSTTEVGKVVVGNKLAQSSDIRRLGSEVARGAEANPTRVGELSEKVNGAVYGALKRMYDLAPETETGDGETPQAFFQRHMGIAESTVRRLAESVNPSDPLLDEPPHEFASPADVIKHLSSPGTTPESRRAVTTRLAFGLTSAEMEQHFEGTTEVLQEVDGMIGSAIIVGPRGSGDIFTVHDNRTNTLARAAITLQALFEEPLDPDVHVKQHDLNGDFQHIGQTEDQTVGLVAVRSRIKSGETALLKTVREAILRTEKADEDTTEAGNLNASDTQDRIGSTFVALEAEHSYDQKVSALRDSVLKQFQALYPNLTEEDFVEDSKTNQRPDSVDFTFQRVLVNNIPGIDGYYEIMFFGQDYFNYKYAVGDTDPETGRPDGCAHSLYEGTRFFKTYNEIFKPNNPEGIERNMYADRVEQLLDDNRIDTADLKKKYEEQQEGASSEVFVRRLPNTGVVFSTV